MAEAQHQGHPVTYWLKLLGSDEEPAQQAAVEALSRLGQAAVPELIRALKDEDWQVRNQAAVALGVIGPEARAAVPALSELLQDEDKYLRSNAATAVGKLGREARSAVPELTKAVKDRDEDVRQNAAAALGRIGPEVFSALFTGSAEVIG
jgi:HEAT repeat protein